MKLRRALSINLKQGSRDGAYSYFCYVIVPDFAYLVLEQPLLLWLYLYPFVSWLNYVVIQYWKSKSGIEELLRWTRWSLSIRRNIFPILLQRAAQGGQRSVQRSHFWRAFGRAKVWTIWLGGERQACARERAKTSFTTETLEETVVVSTAASSNIF